MLSIRGLTSVLSLKYVEATAIENNTNRNLASD